MRNEDTDGDLWKLTGRIPKFATGEIDERVVQILVRLVRDDDRIGGVSSRSGGVVNGKSAVVAAGPSRFLAREDVRGVLFVEFTSA